MLRKVAMSREQSGSIFTQGDTWEELRANVLEATSLHFEDSPERPSMIRLHYVKNELILLETAEECGITGASKAETLPTEPRA